MTRLSVSDQQLIRRMLESGRIDRPGAQELLQSLDLHRVKNPKLTLADLILQRMEISEADNSPAQEDAPTIDPEITEEDLDSAIAALGGAPPAAAMPRAPAAHGSRSHGKHSAHGVHPHPSIHNIKRPSRVRSAILLVLGLTIAGGAVGGFFYTFARANQKIKRGTSSTPTVQTQLAPLPAPGGNPAVSPALFAPAASAPVEPSTPEEKAIQDEIYTVRKIALPKRRHESYVYAIDRCPAGAFKDDLRAELKADVTRCSRSVEDELSKLAGLLQSGQPGTDLSFVADGLIRITQRYGALVLDGDIRDSWLRTRRLLEEHAGRANADLERAAGVINPASEASKASNAPSPPSDDSKPAGAAATPHGA